MNWRLAAVTPRQIVIHVCRGCGFEWATCEGEKPKGWVVRGADEWCARRIKGVRCLPIQRVR